MALLAISFGVGCFISGWAVAEYRRYLAQPTRGPAADQRHEGNELEMLPTVALTAEWVVAKMRYLSAMLSWTVAEVRCRRARERRQRWAQPTRGPVADEGHDGDESEMLSTVEVIVECARKMHDLKADHTPWSVSLYCRNCRHHFSWLRCDNYTSFNDYQEINEIMRREWTKP